MHNQKIFLQSQKYTNTITIIKMLKNMNTKKESSQDLIKNKINRTQCKTQVTA